MKFSISNPPSQDAGTEAVVAWLWELYEVLGAVLENLGSENFCDEMQKKLGYHI